MNCLPVQATPRRAGWIIPAAAILALAACTGKTDSGDEAALPNLDSALGGSGGDRDTGYSFQPDTFDGSGLDQQPNNTLLVKHVGGWSLSPLGGPYRAAVGELVVEEFIDGDDDQPWCWVVYSMTGEIVDDGRAGGCSTCDFVFDIEFYVNQDGGLRPEDGAVPIDTGGNYDEDDVVDTNGREDCRSPEMPADGERWLMGWSEDEGTLYMEYYGSGIWLPWYEGELSFDQLSFSWIDEFGFVVPPEEEED